MTTQLQETFDAALVNRKLLQHPFYQRWEAGELKDGELTSYAEQYRYFETMLPDFLTRLSETLPAGPTRDAVLDNYRDEVSPPSHLELFEKFADFYDAADAPISPAMAALVASYDEVLHESPAAALAGLLAYESQGAAIADSKAAGLLKHYKASNDATAFWTVHGSVEGDHAKWTMDALASIEPDNTDVEAGARLVGEAWWSFLDERELLAI
ncbi:MAG TPA: iron-containing redox enzyme family protein [Acidimicrobiales bacterium]|jgi:pyrroloquinoline-quinone synthase|nr:iron-containing redox enzyme family protein [Acidimicrobiales bacterium]